MRISDWSSDVCSSDLIGHMERRQDGHWLTVWKAPLANDVAPVDAVVSNAGVSMTFDNWHGLGWGDDALVFYSADGSQILKFGSAALLPGFYVEALPRPLSSLPRRGSPHMHAASGQIVLPVVVPTAAAQVGQPPRS